MFVAPLLTFLSYALAHHDDTVVSQSADDRFGDAAARSNLRHTRLVGYGVDDIGRGGLSQLLAGDNRDGGCRVFEFGVACHTRHHQFVQFQVTEKHIRRVRRMLVVIMVLMLLGRHCRAYPQQ